MPVEAIRWVEREIMYDCGAPGIPPQPMKIQVLQYARYENTPYAGWKLIWYDVPSMQEERNTNLAGNSR